MGGNPTNKRRIIMSQLEFLKKSLISGLLASLALGAMYTCGRIDQQLEEDLASYPEDEQ